MQVGEMILRYLQMIVELQSNTINLVCGQYLYHCIKQTTIPT